MGFMGGAFLTLPFVQTQLIFICLHVALYVLLSFSKKIPLFDYFFYRKYKDILNVECIKI